MREGKEVEGGNEKRWSQGRRRGGVREEEEMERANAKKLSE